VSIGSSLAEVKQTVKKAIEFYIEVMQEHGESIPEPWHVIGGV
jgi:predicted RNase H-like HicB family nuclease